MIMDKLHLSEMLETAQFHQKKSFCQIATIANNNGRYRPKARTVLLYYSELLQALYFTCSIRTTKWRELQQTPYLTGVLFIPSLLIQYQ